MQKNGYFAHFCTDAPMQHGAVGADGATRNVLYKNPESITEIDTAIKHVARHKTRYTNHMATTPCNQKADTL